MVSDQQRELMKALNVHSPTVTLSTRKMIRPAVGRRRRRNGADLGLLPVAVREPGVALSEMLARSRRRGNVRRAAPPEAATAEWIRHVPQGGATSAAGRAGYRPRPHPSHGS